MPVSLAGGSTPQTRQQRCHGAGWRDGGAVASTDAASTHHMPKRELDRDSRPLAQLEDAANELFIIEKGTIRVGSMRGPRARQRMQLGTCLGTHAHLQGECFPDNPPVPFLHALLHIAAFRWMNSFTRQPLTRSGKKTIPPLTQPAHSRRMHGRPAARPRSSRPLPPRFRTASARGAASSPAPTSAAPAAWWVRRTFTWRARTARAPCAAARWPGCCASHAQVSPTRVAGGLGCAAARSGQSCCGMRPRQAAELGRCICGGLVGLLL